MRVAMPMFGDRISPRFDCAASFLVATLQQGEVTERIELNAENWAPHERINRLMELGIDAVICGGIDRWSVASLESVGVALHAWVSGPIDATLEMLRRGVFPESSDTVGDARCGMGRGQGRGRRRHGLRP